MRTEPTVSDDPNATPIEAKTLTAADILAADDRRIEPVDVPEWGGRVYVRTMTAEDRERYDDLILDDDGKFSGQGRVMASLLACTCCGPDGTTLFTADQAKALAAKSAAAVVRVYQAAAALNKMRRVDREVEKKGSPAAPAAG
jgi:hypothetical protein